jgi:hypothetical protein
LLLPLYLLTPQAKKNVLAFLLPVKMIVQPALAHRAQEHQKSIIKRTLGNMSQRVRVPPWNHQPQTQGLANSTHSK